MENTGVNPTNDVPNPGSLEAVETGCECPVFENWQGKGSSYGQGVFIYAVDCPLHTTVGKQHAIELVIPWEKL